MTEVPEDLKKLTAEQLAAWATRLIDMEIPYDGEADRLKVELLRRLKRFDVRDEEERRLAVLVFTAQAAAVMNRNWLTYYGRPLTAAGHDELAALLFNFFQAAAQEKP